MDFKSEFYKEIYILQNGSMKVFFMERNGCSIRTYFGNLSSELKVSKWARYKTLARARSRIRKTYEQLIGLFGYSESVEEAYDPIYGIKHVPYRLFLECREKLQPPIFVAKSTGGVRVIVCKNGSFYRNGRRHAKIESFVNGELVDFFKRNPNAILDGEIYPLKDSKRLDDFLEGLSLQRRVAKCRFLIFDGFNVGCSDKDQYSYRISRIRDYISGFNLVSVSDTRRYDSVNQAFHSFKSEMHIHGYVVKEACAPYKLIAHYGSTFHHTYKHLKIQIKSFIENKSGLPTHVVSAEGKAYKIKDTKRIREGMAKNKSKYINKDAKVYYDPLSQRNKRSAKFFPRKFKFFDFFY